MGVVPEEVLDDVIIGDSFPERSGLITQLSQLFHVHRSLINTLVTFGMRVTAAVLMYCLQILLARLFGADNYGRYIQLWTGITICGFILAFGFNTTSQHFIPLYEEKAKPSFALGYANFTRIFPFLLALVFSCFSFLPVWYFFQHGGGEFYYAMLIALACIPLFSITEIQEGIARSWGWMVTGIFPGYILRPILIMLFVVFFTLEGFDGWVPQFNDNLQLHNAYVLTFLACASVYLLQMLVVNFRIRRQLQTTQSSFEIKRWLRYAFPVAKVELCYIVYQFIDILALSYFVPPDQVGIYFVATKTFALVAYLQYAVSSSRSHELARLHIRGETALLAQKIKSSMVLAFVPSVLGTVVMVLAAPLFLKAFGSDFKDGMDIILIVALAPLIKSLIGANDRLLIVTGEQKRLFKVMLVALCSAILFHSIFIPLFGLKGAAIALVLTTSVEVTLTAMLVRRVFGLSFFMNPVQKVPLKS